MNFDIKFDFQRRERLGLIEAIWGQDKSIDQLRRLSESVLVKMKLFLLLGLIVKKLQIFWICMIMPDSSKKQNA